MSDEALINVRSQRYFIVQSRASCKYCKRSTRCWALAVPPGHEILDVAEDAQHDRWVTAAHHAVLFHLEHVGAAVAARLTALSPLYRLVRAEPNGQPEWRNHCATCNSCLDDEDLFCEPGEGFFSMSRDDAVARELLSVEEPFEAAAGGYTMDVDS